MFAAVVDCGGGGGDRIYFGLLHVLDFVQMMVYKIADCVFVYLQNNILGQNYQIRMFLCDGVCVCDSVSESDLVQFYLHFFQYIVF